MSIAKRGIPPVFLQLIGWGVPSVWTLTHGWGVFCVWLASGLGIVWIALSLVTWNPIRRRLHFENLAFVRIADWFDVKPFSVHYIASRWVIPGQELAVQASLKSRGMALSVTGAELKASGKPVAYKDISRPGASPFRLPMISPVEEQAFTISFVIPERLQGKSHRMRLCVTAGGKRYFSEPDYLNLDYSNILRRGE